MKKGAGYRKANYAACVRINMPLVAGCRDRQENKSSAFFTNKDGDMAK
jgi:hypothetical protein